MSLFKWVNEKIKILSWVDLKLIGLVGFCLGIILAILIPRLLDINIWWFVVIMVLSYIKICYMILFKK